MNINIPSWILIYWHLIETFLAWFGLILSQDCDMAAVASTWIAGESDARGRLAGRKMAGIDFFRVP